MKIKKIRTRTIHFNGGESGSIADINRINNKPIVATSMVGFIAYTNGSNNEPIVRAIDDGGFADTNSSNNKPIRFGDGSSNHVE